MGATECSLPVTYALGDGSATDHRTAASRSVVGVGIDGEAFGNRIDVLRIETIAVTGEQVMNRPAIVVCRHQRTT